MRLFFVHIQSSQTARICTVLIGFSRHDVFSDTAFLIAYGNAYRCVFHNLFLQEGATFARKVMRFSGLVPGVLRRPRMAGNSAFLIPEDPRNIAAENLPEIFRFGDAFSGEELSSTVAETVPVA